MPVGMGASNLAADWRRVQDAAADRERSLEVCMRANVAYMPKPYEGAGRMPFQGSVAQIVEDVAAHAETGVGEILLELQSTPRDAEELIDVAAEVYAAARAAGI
ncbi:hypothetical protein GCM10020367_10450 [Streptomyces sannanensis]|uniref:Xylose isomerase-like TIM barrel domain-containing protein n=2 Tax=Streptomyces sannanensis TaxID=285536 RepID=A0ABP6S6H5_9ACTN